MSITLPFSEVSIGMSIIAVLVCSLVVVGAAPHEGPTGGQVTPSGSVSESQSPFSKNKES